MQRVNIFEMREDRKSTNISSVQHCSFGTVSYELICTQLREGEIPAKPKLFASLHFLVSGSFQRTDVVAAVTHAKPII